MNFSQVPTDNLYKFMAIFGLILILFFGASIFAASRGLEPALEKYAVVSRDINNTLEELNAIQRQSSALTPAEVALVTQNINSVLINISEGQAYVNSFQILLVAGKLSLIIGILLSGTGFCLWYLRTQRYQDKILKKQAEQVG